MEGRRHKRAQVKVGCWIVLQDGESSCCNTFDISDSGISISTSKPLPVGLTVCLQFYTPHSASPICISAEVIWSSTDQNAVMGLKFLDITCEEMKRLNDMKIQAAHRELSANKFNGLH